MPNASVRVDEDFYRQISRYAELKDVSIAEIFRQGAQQLMDGEHPPKHTVDTNGEHRQNRTIEVFEQQLQAKDEQLRELTHLLSQEQHIAAMAHKHLTDTTQQLDQTRRALESATKKRSWFHQLMGKNKAG